MTPIPNYDGKVSVDEVHQYDLAFRINTSSRKVLRECLVGIIITKPKSERGKIRRKRGIRMKRVPGQNGLRLGAIDTTNVNRIKRGKK